MALALMTSRSKTLPTSRRNHQTSAPAPWPLALAGGLALAFFRQLDSEAADDALAGQSVKCLVFLCTAMYEDDSAAGRLPPPLRLSGGGANGHATNGSGDVAAAAAEDAGGSEDEDEAAEEEEEDVAEAAVAGGSGSEAEEDAEDAAAEATAAEEAAAGRLTLHALIRRMVRLADDKTYARQLQRGVALRFVAAVASRLGADRVLPYLPLLMRPLYRITEPGGWRAPGPRRAALSAAAAGCWAERICR